MRYVRLRSLTWWASATPIALGAFVATLPIHGLDTWVAVVNEATEGMSPYALINAGLVGIGLREAMVRK